MNEKKLTAAVQTAHASLHEIELSYSAMDEKDPRAAKMRANIEKLREVCSDLDMLREQTDFELVRDYLWHSGCRRDVLTADQHLLLVSNCNGYGELSAEELTDRGLDWDWSHVRDSEDGTIALIAAWIRDFLKEHAHG